MDPNVASEQIQIIRTLMERAALYRRAMAPLMAAAGITGLLGGGIGYAAALGPDWRFVTMWSGVAFVALIISLLLVRRQALKDSEPFWSPPTRRVAQAMLPGLAAGSLVGPLSLIFNPGLIPSEILPSLWMVLYGCSLCSAGFFISRGVRILGWLFLLCGCAVLCVHGTFRISGLPDIEMAASFGGLHLASGIYLFFTEKNQAKQ
ncbi:MAG: hypothetical protein WCR20_10200 [Verrucomicrobiota bacterium]